MQWIELSKIKATPESQARDGKIDEATVSAYAETMRTMGSKRFPPVDLYYDGDVYHIGDGFHRVIAARRAGFGNIRATVVDGTASDAIWHACAANQAHGLRRTNRDKARAVRLAITHPKGASLSNAEIARFVGVSDNMVARVRAMIAPTPAMRSRNDQVRQVARNAVRSARVAPPPPRTPPASDMSLRSSEAAQDKALRNVWADVAPSKPYPGPAAVSQVAGERVTAMGRIMNALNIKDPDAAADAVVTLIKWARHIDGAPLP